MRNLLAILVLLTALAGARPVGVDTVDVPLDQLLARYRKVVHRAPQDSHAHYVLGRLNAIAYAMAPGSKFPEDRKTNKPFFGYFDNGIPPQVTAASAHPEQRLKEAVREYGEAVRLEPDFLAARLGWAWCLDQSKRKSDAIEQYRKVFAQAYKRETTGNPGLGQSVGAESGRYLLALLSPDRDAAEVADLKKKLEELQAVPRPVTPILIPLSGAPFDELVNPKAGVSFDLDGSGWRRPWGWITPKAAWLVYRDRRTHIESGLQMFGSVSFWIFWKDGYQALSALDTDGDGELRGQELAHLQLWQDRNRDGISQTEELLPLSRQGIVGLSTRGRPHPQGTFSPRGVRYADGHRGPSYDWVVR